MHPVWLLLEKFRIIGIPFIFAWNLDNFHLNNFAICSSNQKILLLPSISVNPNPCLWKSVPEISCYFKFQELRTNRDLQVLRDSHVAEKGFHFKAEEAAGVK